MDDIIIAEKINLYSQPVKAHILYRNPVSGHLLKKKLTNKLTNKQIKTILPGAYKLYQIVY